MKVILKFICDRCGDHLEFPYEIQNESGITRTVVEMKLRSIGWYASDEVCRCPDCRKKPFPARLRSLQTKRSLPRNLIPGDGGRDGRADQQEASASLRDRCGLKGGAL